jgi:tRNA(adenine34) deaminase
MRVDFSDEYFMKIALQEAKKAFDKDEIPVGAVIIANNQILSKSHNLTETLKDPTAHAEMQAITAASELMGGKYLMDCTLYVTLEPCTMCAGATFWSQLGRIVFGAYDEKRGYSVFATNILHPKTKIVGGVLENDSKQLLNEFFTRLRSQ